MNRIVLVLIIVHCSFSVTAADIERLFFTDKEREALEAERHRVVVEVPDEAFETPDISLPEDPSEIEEVVIKPTLTVDGYVRRSAGQATLWVNGESSYDGNLGASLVKPTRAHVFGTRVRLNPLDDGASVLLKPGQTYDPNGLSISDIYERPPNHLKGIEETAAN